MKFSIIFYNVIIKGLCLIGITGVILDILDNQKKHNACDRK